LLLAAGADAEDACDVPPDAVLPGAAVLVEAALGELLPDDALAGATVTVDSAAETAVTLETGTGPIAGPMGPNDSIRDKALLDGADAVGSAGNNVLDLGTATGPVVGLVVPNEERLKTCMALPPC
jgi:hypothetical protein